MRARTRSCRLLHTVARGAAIAATALAASAAAYEFNDSHFHLTNYVQHGPSLADFLRTCMADRTGRVVTFTFDFFFPTPDPPTVVTVTEVDGARIHLQLINTTPEEVKLDMPVEFVFRRIHETGGRPNYYWKATPLERHA